MEEEDRQRYADNFKMYVVEKDPTKCMDGDADDVVDLSADIPWKTNDVDVEENSIDMEEVKTAVESSRTLSFCKRMKRLSLHCLSLKEQMKDQTISYVDLLHPYPLPSRMDDERKPRASRSLARRKLR